MSSELFELTNAESEAAIALLRELVQTDTVNPPGREARAAAVIARWLEEAGIQASVHTFAPERANLTARLAGAAASDGKRPRRALVLSGHTDTVPPGERPWQRDPWSAEIADGRLYGRGATDMKSGLAAMVMAMICLQRRGLPLPMDLLLAVSAGEEVDCIGARQLVADGLLADAAGIVVGEPTAGEVVTAHKGALWLELTTEGRTSHGAMPHKGINAILRMHEVISRLQTLDLARHSHPLLGHSTLSLNTIHGGTQPNVVPDRCTARLDIRTVPGQRHADVLAEVEAVLAGLDWPVGISVLTDLAPVGTDADAPLVQVALRVASQLSGRQQAPAGAVYYTDAAIYQPALNVPVVLYGPGEPEQAHQPDESVDIAAYLAAIRFYAALAQQSL